MGLSRLQLQCIILRIISAYLLMLHVLIMKQ